MVSTRQSSSMSGSNGGGPVADVTDVNSSRRHQSVAMTSSYNGASVSEPPPYSNLNLLDLPVEILEKIFSYLDYNTVAHLRPVSQNNENYRNETFIFLFYIYKRKYIFVCLFFL